MERILKNIEYLVNELKKIGLQLNNKQLEQLVKYYEMLICKNEVMNLTAITQWEDVVLKHFIDSLSLVNYFDLSKALRVLDLGTGAGFPGIPLKIAFPHLEMVLLDSLNKRVSFLQEVIDDLELTNILAIHNRAEEYQKSENTRERFDLVVSRAVANLASLSEYCLPYVTVGGYFIPYKSGNIDTELEASKNALSILGGKLEEVNNFMLPDSDIGRTFVKIKKTRNTPKKYPRNAGKPTKEPLA